MHPTNPLLNFEDLPLFDAIRPEHIAPAVDALIAQCQSALRQVTATSFQAEWETLSKTLDTATERLGRAWGAVGHLNAVADSPELRAAYNAALPQVSEFWTLLGSNAALFGKYRAIDPSTLNAERQAALRLSLQGFELGGAKLTGDAKDAHTANAMRQAELSQSFSEHVLDATQAFAYYAELGELAGVPQSVVDAALAAAQAENKAGYKLTLKMPSFLPVMQYAHSSTLRQTLYTAHNQRASELGDAAFDNSALLAETLQLRSQEAQLLGFANYAQLSLAPKMADSPEQVEAFLLELAHKAKPYAQADVAALRDFAKTELQWTHEPQPWDWPYLGERLKEARYAFSDDAVRQYFPAPRVLAGLFALIEQLFGVRIAEATAPLWHPDAKFYRIEKANDDGSMRLVGQFYLDCPARYGKRGGAWMDDVRSRWLRPDTAQLQIPVAHLVCNFDSGLNGKPALLTHDDVTTLFHEFGHGLHHLLTQVNERDVAGISGVEWDAVELPSQFMENFCWDWQVLQGMTAHVDTGEPLPRTLYDKMLAAKNYQSGLMTLRQIEFALFDLRVHTRTDIASAADVLAVWHQVRREVALLPIPDTNRMPHSFSHIFAGGYAAGYYSYKWAEVLSADVYAAFEEAAPEGGIDAATGARYLNEILSKGASRTALENFKAFRGREPSLEPLLRHQGMSS